MATAKTSEYIGKFGWFTVEGMKFEIQIVDHRINFGRDDFKIIPGGPQLGDRGNRWVSSHRVALMTHQPVTH